MDSSASSSFLRLPFSIRQRIYSHLLAPHPSETSTYINYVLHWPFLENPSNTTFNGACQLDLCQCPQVSPQFRSKNDDHIYSRYRCYGPEVKFKTGKEDLWVPARGYTNSGQINFLEPGKRWGGHDENAPCLAILLTSKAIYREAVVELYRKRNFCFATGPCPRGRYQAYATEYFLSRLSPFARKGVTGLKIVAVPHEEDTRTGDAETAYKNLVAYVQLCLPGFEKLSLDLNFEMRSAVGPLRRVFEKEGVEICFNDGTGELTCGNVLEFEAALRRLQGKEEPKHTHASKSDKHTNFQRTHSRRPSKKFAARKSTPVWIEVQEESIVTDKANEDPLIMALKSEKKPPPNMMLRRVSTIKRLSRREKKKKIEIVVTEKTDDWVDASLSSEGDSWEVL